GGGGREASAICREDASIGTAGGAPAICRLHTEAPKSRGVAVAEWTRLQFAGRTRVTGLANDQPEAILPGLPGEGQGGSPAGSLMATARSSTGCLAVVDRRRRAGRGCTCGVS